jgi:hypothetical protein
MCVGEHRGNQCAHARLERVLCARVAQCTRSHGEVGIVDQPERIGGARGMHGPHTERRDKVDRIAEDRQFGVAVLEVVQACGGRDDRVDLIGGVVFWW